MGWTGPGSLEERVATMAVALLVALVALAGVLWGADELAGWLAHGAWPPVGPDSAAAVALAFLQHPTNPAAGWPAAARRLAPPLWLFALVLAGLLVAAGAVALVVATRMLDRSATYGGAGSLPAGVLSWARNGPSERPFLGWVGWGLFTRAVLGTVEDCVAVVGPPRVGKTLFVLIPQVLRWQGAVVAASTKPDVLRATVARRRRLVLPGTDLVDREAGPAATTGRGVLRWAPTLSTPAPPGVVAVGWSPLSGCERDDVCERRVRALVNASGVGRGTRYADHWRTNAVRLLRGYFHAAAIDGRGVRGLLRWLARNELREPALVLARTGTAVAQGWSEELEGMSRVPTEEIGSIFSAARTALGSLQNGRVLASCDGPRQLDVDELLLTRSTLHLVAPTSDQDLLAPLAAALVEHLVDRTYELWERGDLPARLLLCLDELANIAPLPSLLKILTQGASQGVNLTWAVQSLAQLRDRYGEQVAAAAFSSSRARLVFGGLTDARDLQAVSQLAGEHEVPARSLTRGGHLGQTSMTAGTVWRPRLPVSALRAVPAGRALLLYHSSDPALVRVRPVRRAATSGAVLRAGGGLARACWRPMAAALAASLAAVRARRSFARRADRG